MFIAPTTYTVARKLKVNGTVYNPGQTIAPDVMAHIRGIDGLLSRKFIIPTPDPHGRKTKPETPAPVTTPAPFREKAVRGKSRTFAGVKDGSNPMKWNFTLSPSEEHSVNYGDSNTWYVSKTGASSHTYTETGTYTVKARIGGRLAKSTTINVTGVLLLDEQSPDAPAADAPAEDDAVKVSKAPKDEEVV